MKKLLIQAVVLTAMLSTGLMAHAANGNSVVVKIGSFSLSNTSNNLGGKTIVFDKKSSSAFSLEYEFQKKNSFAWGVELVSYSNANVPGTYSSADTTLVIGNGRKYFDAGKYIKPFVGFGIGTTSVRFNNGGGNGISIQAMAGVKIPFEKFSVVVEYKTVNSKAKDVDGDIIDTSGSGIFAGVAYSF